MIKCIKCNELIGNDATRCPLCGYDYSPKELQELRRNAAREEIKSETNAAIETNRFINRFIFGKILTALTGILFLALPAIFPRITDAPLYVPMIIMGALFVFSLVYAIRYSKCPYCKYMFAIKPTKFFDLEKCALHCKLCGSTFEYKEITHKGTGNKQ